MTIDIRQTVNKTEYFLIGFFITTNKSLKELQLNVHACVF